MKWTLQVMDAFASLHAWAFRNENKWKNNPNMQMSFTKMTEFTGGSV